MDSLKSTNFLLPSFLLVLELPAAESEVAAQLAYREKSPFRFAYIDCFLVLKLLNSSGRLLSKKEGLDEPLVFLALLVTELDRLLSEILHFGLVFPREKAVCILI